MEVQYTNSVWRNTICRDCKIFCIIRNQGLVITSCKSYVAREHDGLPGLKNN